MYPSIAHPGRHWIIAALITISHTVAGLSGGCSTLRQGGASLEFVGHLINGFLQQTFNGNYSMDMWIANLIPCLMVFIAFIINMLFIPSMTQATLFALLRPSLAGCVPESSSSSGPSPEVAAYSSLLANR